MRILTYCGALLLGAALISLSLKAPDSGHNKAFPVVNVSNEQAIVNPDTAAPSMDLSIEESNASSSEDSNHTAVSLILGDKTISLGESEESLIKKLGMPERIADTEYDFNFYVYNRDYRNLIFVAVKEGVIEGFYTDSLRFNFMGITPESDLEEINRVLGSDFSMSEVLSFEADGFIGKILMDQIDTGRATGIYVLSSNVIEDGYDDNAIRDAELLNYDLVNSLRKRNDLPLLAWSSTAAKASRKHSLDMAENDYFDHIGLEGSLPGDRLMEEGLSIQRVGENIIAGYGSAILSNHAWFNSPGHRKNMLNPEYICLGVGFTYREDSAYKTYMTQVFYK